MTGEGMEALAGIMDVGVQRLAGIALKQSSTEDSPVDADLVPLASVPAGEPLIDGQAAADIQGNVFPGFNKDHQRFLFLTMNVTDDARTWLRWLAPRLSSMQEVLDFRREFRRERLLTGTTEPSKPATWIAFALSHHAICKLLGKHAGDEMGDEAFRQGMAARSTLLGDPAEQSLPGHRERWRVGGPDSEVDFLVIVAADIAQDVEQAAAEIVQAAARGGLTLSFEQVGENLPGNLSGHEHFGFKDGISQPGIRGVTSDGEHLSPRYLDPRNPHSRIFGKPGQPLVWPGQFLLGLPRQDPADPLAPAEDNGNFPAWARNGSYLVCRRLNQDVPAFWDFAATASREYGTSPVRFASMMVGRWPSGAPISRSPHEDDLSLAGDEFAHNHFLFDDDTTHWLPSKELAEAGYKEDDHTRATADIFGQTCPMAGHIRKVNPRDSGTDFGASADTMLRLMMRRGIPYGPVLAGVKDPPPQLIAAERGLMFVAYMSSIEDQFEFVTRRWANSSLQPNASGHDPIIGQSDVHGDRERTLELRLPGGDRERFSLPREWITPTGGGYFFAPAISAVGNVLANGEVGDH
ncbi:Dyp-type peroxidase [Microbacterium sp. DT81.1]|uniref:Dyp-type peroxidase n=1 Tax=Microbacterium sp. DT81.1 TaxID=3393413 RepID=UPI003CED8938